MLGRAERVGTLSGTIRGLNLSPSVRTVCEPESIVAQLGIQSPTGREDPKRLPEDRLHRRASAALRSPGPRGWENRQLKIDREILREPLLVCGWHGCQQSKTQAPPLGFPSSGGARLLFRRQRQRIEDRLVKVDVHHVLRCVRNMTSSA